MIERYISMSWEDGENIIPDLMIGDWYKLKPNLKNCKRRLCYSEITCCSNQLIHISNNLHSKIITIDELKQYISRLKKEVHLGR